MRAFPIAMMLAVLAGPAYAQMPAMNLLTDRPALTSEEIERQKALDEAYQSAIKKVPAQKPSTDPWGNVRAPEPAKGGESKSGETKTTQAKAAQAKSSQAKSTQAKPQQPVAR